MTISLGVIIPCPALSVTIFRACADSRFCGIAVRELGVTWSHKTEDAISASAARAARSTEIGLRITNLPIRAHIPDIKSLRAISPWNLYGVTPRRPRIESIAG
ncbi:unannotated protein [freshwater metagenome]|uniref:Unannotated protein n=1 Tax=freshwater metagenome TaxID=449393 RepID=A0A6J7BA96_9ZZZZ